MESNLLVDTLHDVCGSSVFEVRLGAREKYSVAHRAFIFFADVWDRRKWPIAGGRCSRVLIISNVYKGSIVWLGI
jgi:hypothetical protein